LFLSAYTQTKANTSFLYKYYIGSVFCSIFIARLNINYCVINAQQSMEKYMAAYFFSTKKIIALFTYGIKRQYNILFSVPNRLLVY
jgi:hypothetical protein